MVGEDLSPEAARWRATTVLCVRRDGQVALGSDGQVSFGNTVVKGNARKVRRMESGGHTVLSGFAGSTADALALFERLEGKMETHAGQLARACVELAKDWRTDRYLRRLEAMLVVADAKGTYLVSGNGDVIEPDDGTIAIGSGGNFALSAARAMLDIPKDGRTAADIVRRSLEIAADICIYTNRNITVETLDE